MLYLIQALEYTDVSFEKALKHSIFFLCVDEGFLFLKMHPFEAIACSVSSGYRHGKCRP